MLGRQRARQGERGRQHEADQESAEGVRHLHGLWLLAARAVKRGRRLI
jgi:hypothetical protein